HRDNRPYPALQARGRDSVKDWHGQAGRATHRWTLVCGLVLALTAAGLSRARAQSAPEDPAKINFEQKVLPIFEANCVSCHGKALKLKDLDLTTFAGVMKGSEAG